jgi:glutamine synthetase
MSDVERWLREREVTEVECLVADLNGIARGKILPAAKFVRSLKDDTLRLPEAIFVQAVTGDYPTEQQDRVTDPAVRDVRMRPDPGSLRLVPWYEEATAQVAAGGGA